MKKVDSVRDGWAVVSGGMRYTLAYMASGDMSVVDILAEEPRRVKRDYNPRSMNTDQLRLFLVIVRHRSLSRTAVELGLGQATVSERLRALEAEVGTPLFERQGRGVSLTPAGEAFRPYAERGLEVLR